MSSTERSIRAQRTSLARWRREGDRTSATLPARQAFLRRFDNEVDPQHELPREERAVRAAAAMKVYMQSLRAKQR